MKICFVAPGEIPIPPTGWGALETVLWNQYVQLQNLGVEVHIVNEKDTNTAFLKIAAISPDVLHLHLGKHFELMPHFNCKKIVTSHDGGFPQSAKFHDAIIRAYLRDCHFFCLTEIEKKFLQGIGLRNSRIKKLPNGVDTSKFQVDESPIFKSICLGKIDKRKRQAMLQAMDLDVDFVGQNASTDFNALSKNYLGPWNREQIYRNLTTYANLILLSETELQPLVCLEAMAAGLGLVISEACTENLDLSKPFITVIPNNKLQDKAYVADAISTNRKISADNRQEIVKYAKTFDWSEIAKKYLEYLK